MPTNHKDQTLIVTKTIFFDLDKLGATIALGKILSTAEAEISILLPAPVSQKQLSEFINFNGVKVGHELNSTNFTLTLDRGDTDIREVSWEQIDGQLKLTIATSTGQLNPTGMKLEPAGAVFDRIFTLGIKTLADVTEALGDDPSVWESATDTINLDLRKENDNFATQNFVNSDIKSFAGLVLEYAREQELEISPELATDLLSCIYWKTNSLRNKYTTKITLEHVQKLVELGADVEAASQKVFSSLSVVEVRAQQEMLQNLKITAERLAFGSISADTAKQLRKLSPISPLKNPLYQIKDVDASFVLIPIDSNNTWVSASAHNPDTNLKKIFGQYKFVGDQLQAELTFHMNVETTEQTIINLFRRRASQQSDTTNSPQVKSQLVETKIFADVEESKQPDPTTPEENQVSKQPITAPTPEDEDSTPDTVEKQDLTSVAEPSTTEPKLQDADPLAPATEKLELADDNDSADISGMGGFGGLGGFGGAPVKDPLPTASSSN